MPIRLQVNNTTSSPVGDDFFQRVAEETFREAGFEFSESKEIFLSLALVAPAEIRRLNKEYRKYDSVTDVLSFAEFKNARALKKAVDKSVDVGVFLGELILCYNDIQEYAKKNKIGLQKELANVVSHGVLHLLGMKHGKKMFAIQDKIIKKQK
jgi:rRNA maturation RNase YbeY